MNLRKCPRMVDFIQTLHHVRLIAEGDGTQRHIGRAVEQCAAGGRQKRLCRWPLETQSRCLASSRAMGQLPAQQYRPGWQHITNTASNHTIHIGFSFAVMAPTLKLKISCDVEPHLWVDVPEAPTFMGSYQFTSPCGQHRSLFHSIGSPACCGSVPYQATPRLLTERFHSQVPVLE